MNSNIDAHANKIAEDEHTVIYEYGGYNLSDPKFLEEGKIPEPMSYNMQEGRMKREYKPVNYSYEHGDESLPHLKDLVSDTPDPMKGKIIGYLRTHCILACPGIVKDEIDPDRTKGILEFAERYIPKDLGSGQMNFYKENFA